MNILFLGDIVGTSGCEAIKKHLPKKIKESKIDFVIANGENAAKEGVGITEKITNNLFDYGVDVITTGNHVWDQKETVKHIEREERLLRPMNLPQLTPGKGFGVYKSINTVLSLVAVVITLLCTKRMVEQYYQLQLINIYIYLVVFLQIILRKNIELYGERLKMFKELIK